MEEKKLYTAEEALNLQAAAYQKGYNEGYELCKQERQGAVWVKASAFKTHKPVYRPYRKPCMEDEGEYDYGEIYVTEDDSRIYLDVDNECNYEHQSDERWKDYEILDESNAQPVEQKENDAVAFAEWIAINNWVLRNDKETWHWGPIGTPKDQWRVLTTHELYNEYQKQTMK